MTTVHSRPASPRGDAPVVVPEDDVIFRLAQLLLLLSSVRRQALPGVTLERLSIYDFFVANPLLVLIDEEDDDRRRLLIAGFDARALSQASPAHRFTTRRERIKHDLVLLVAYGLVEPAVDRGVLYAVTSEGMELADKFRAVYARSYRLSAEILVRRLSKLSDQRLRQSVRTWTAVVADRPDFEILELLDTAR